MPKALDGGSGSSGGGTRPGGGGGGSSKPLGAQPSLITSTGGLVGFNNTLLIPFFDTRTGMEYFVTYDPTNFNCEDDCIYKFRLESVAPGRTIDIHKVFIEYRDLGKVTFTTRVEATQYNKATKKETLVYKSVVSTVGKGDKKIHSLFVDLKVNGERPQLIIIRKADDGPFSLVRAMLVGNSSEEQLV